LHLAEGAHHDVGGLQVAVNDAASVGVGNRQADLFEDGEESPPAACRVRPLLQQRGERAALYELHGEVRPTVGLHAHPIHGNDAGVLQLAADLGLLHEPLQHLGVLGVLLAQHLEGDVAREIAVPALQHDADAAARDLAEDLVALVIGRILGGHAEYRRGVVGRVAE
jgi:hypothetical protein